MLATPRLFKFFTLVMEVSVIVRREMITRLIMETAILVVRVVVMG
jgi:hypothetical protein